jgi:hypothetical protein
MLQLHTNKGIVTVTEYDTIEEFSVEWLTSDSPMLKIDREFITVIAANGVWVYRMVGHNFDGRSVKAVLHSYKWYPVPTEVI